MQFVGNENWDNENWDTTRFHIYKGIVPGYWKEKTRKAIPFLNVEKTYNIMILNNIIIMFNLMKWKFIYIQMNNEKKSTQTILSERHQSWKKKYLYSKEWFNKKRRKWKIVTKTYTWLMTLKDIETKDFRM